MPTVGSLLSFAVRALAEHAPRLVVEYGLPALEGSLRRSTPRLPQLDALLVERINATLPAWHRAWTPSEAFEFACYFLSVRPSDPGENGAAPEHGVSVEWTREPRFGVDLIVRGTMLEGPEFEALRDDVEAALRDAIEHVRALPRAADLIALAGLQRFGGPPSRPDDANVATWLLVPVAVPFAVASYYADRASRRRAVASTVRFVELLAGCGLSTAETRRLLLDAGLPPDLIRHAFAAYHAGS